jgi:hypothetical protein
MADISGSELEKQSDEPLYLLCSPCKRKEEIKKRTNIAQIAMIITARIV